MSVVDDVVGVGDADNGKEAEKVARAADRAAKKKCKVADKATQKKTKIPKPTQ